MTNPEPVDPVEQRNQDDEQQVLELAQLDEQLDAEQQRLDAEFHRDALRIMWFDE